MPLRWKKVISLTMLGLLAGLDFARSAPPTATAEIVVPTEAPAVPAPTPPAAPAPAPKPIQPAGFGVPGGKDFFGPPLGSNFDEKSIFPEPPPALKATSAAQALPAPKPFMLSDGTVLPPPPPLVPPPKLWAGGFEFGLNGSQGNADVFNMRFGANADRRSENNRFHTDLLYNINRESGITKQNQAILNSRDEILFGDSPWGVFSSLQIEYDEFRDYNFTVGTYLGSSYRWWKTVNTFCSTRIGAGAVRQLAQNEATPSRWVPEALLGGDFNHRFTDRQAWVSSLDLYPNLSQLGNYRLRVRAAYEIVIDPSHGMVLRMGIQDRYDSLPGTAKRNDVNYFTSLMFKF